MDDPVFKQKYQKYKLRVKMWERDFKRKYSRIPSKYDIREAPQDIRDAYKMYYKLKTSYLEDTLNDVLAEDGFDVLEISQTGSDFGADISQSGETSTLNTPQLPMNISAIVQSSAMTVSAATVGHSLDNLAEVPNAATISNSTELHAYKHYKALAHCQLNGDDQGSDINKSSMQTKKQEDTIVSKRPFTANLSAKLFKASSFSKRNPRKSLSRNNSETMTKLTRQESAPCALDRSQEILPDLETILVQKAKEQQANGIITVNPMLAGKEASNMQVDSGWLSRTTSLDSFKTDKLRKDIEKNTPLAAKRNYGLSNIDVSKFLPKVETTTNDDLGTEQNITPTNRCVPEFPINKTVHDIVTDRIHAKRRNCDDSDSVVSDSADEKESNSYRHIAKRRRVLNTIDKNKKSINIAQLHNLTQITENTEVCTPDTLKINKIISKPVEAIREEGTIIDNDPNEDCVPLKQTKGNRKRRVTAVRDRAPENVQVKRKKATNSAVPRIKKPKRVTTLAGKSTTGSTGKLSKRGKKTTSLSEVEVTNLEELEVPEKPPVPEDLRYALLLERGDITCTPRIHLRELETADNVAQNYINTVSIGSTKPAAVPEGYPPINEKIVKDRKRLEDKIAAGKLNENYVTVNLQKKIYARGKKHISYSKYKKKQWRHKKRIAALSGPDMDMGGCDGGVLTCFTCGGVGHFAANCKIKGDSLLPLTAQLEEDPSPFPTLEEAEQMAAQSAVAAHSRNIQKLPAATNAAIYRSNETDNDGTGNDVNEKQIELTGCDETDVDLIDNLDFKSDKELEQVNLDSGTQISPIRNYVGHKIPEDFLRKAGLHGNVDSGAKPSQLGTVGALYDLNMDGSVRDVTPEVFEALYLFGHSNFRKGQDRAIMRILSGLSTLVTLSTGSGKSLCYQLPAYLYSRQRGSITLVISPLVSLMEDQVTGVPHFLRAHCLHTNQTPQHRLKVMEMIGAGEVDILLVSPEAVMAGERSTGFGAILRQLPSIAFACIDEAHCVSQWSHNFRPSYLMICKVLKQNLGVKTVLGLTATATLPTRLSIINHLGITDGELGVISDTPLPDNLLLSVSKDENKDASLLALLNSERFSNCHSIIIYCTRRDECERVATYLRTCMQDGSNEFQGSTNKKRKRLHWSSEPYHAGMPASRRRTIQNAFMRNELRIVVATIAFGMGINKPDLRAVIHYNMPRNFESYVQEIGRAGRDGKQAHCHLFLDARGDDRFELRRHIYANSIDRHVIRKLLQHVFVPCACDKSKEQSKGADMNDDAKSVRNVRNCPGHEIGIPIESTVQELDIPEENISTLLCYMELDERCNINLLSSAYTMAKVISYGGAKYLKHAAKECPPLAMAIAMEIKKNTFKEDANIIEFSVVDVAAAIGWNSGIVKHQLKNLEWINVNGYPRRSPINVNFFDLGLRIKAPGDFSAEEIDEALDTLYNRAVKQEQTQLIQLQYVFQGLSSVAYNSYKPCCSATFAPDRSNQLKGIIRDYFQNDYPKELKLEVDVVSERDQDIEDCVHTLINLYPDNNFSGRNVARIFHGISSPNYPAVMWSRCKYWRALPKVDFNRIVKLANAVIVRRRM